MLDSRRRTIALLAPSHVDIDATGMGNALARMSCIADFPGLHASTRLLAVAYYGGRESALRGADVLEVIGDVPLIAYVSPDPLGHADLAACSVRGSGVHMALGDMPAFIGKLRGTVACAPEPSPVGAVVRALMDRTPVPLRSMLLAGACVGERRASLDHFLVACNRSARTARYQLASAGWPSPASLPAWFTGAYVAYWTEYLGLPLKQVAARTNSGSVDALRQYLRARTERAPTEWRALGFAGAIEVLAARLALAD